MTASDSSFHLVITECEGGYRIGNNSNVKLNGFSGTLPEVLTLPSSYEGKNIIEVGQFAFNSNLSRNHPLKYLFLEEGIRVIGYNSFRELRPLKFVSLPSSLISIGQSAFDDDYDLETAHINQPSSLTSIGISAFSTCKKLKEFVIPDSIQSVGFKSFAEIETSLKIYYCGRYQVQTADSIFNSTDYQIIVPFNGVKRFGQYPTVYGAVPCYIKALGTCVIRSSRRPLLCYYFICLLT